LLKGIEDAFCEIKSVARESVAKKKRKSAKSAGTYFSGTAIKTKREAFASLLVNQPTMKKTIFKTKYYYVLYVKGKIFFGGDY